MATRKTDSQGKRKESEGNTEMAIMKNGEIDLKALRKARQAKATRVDLVAGLKQISPEIEMLKVGQTCSIENVKKDDIRKTVMSVTAKLSHLTARGGEWAGRNYDVASDADAGIVYVQRQTGVKPEDAPIRRTGGGRKRKTDTEATEASNASEESNDSEATEEATSGNGVAIVEHA